MFKLLPTEEKKHLKREYHVRVWIVLFMFTLGAIIVGNISLLPSYLRSTVKDDSASKQFNHLKQISAINSDPKFITELKNAQNQIAELGAGLNEQPVRHIFDTITKDRPQGLRITSLTLTRNRGNNAVRLTGIAPTRESLVTFKKTLETETMFKAVESPVSELAKSKNIGFSLVVTGTF